MKLLIAILMLCLTANCFAQVDLPEEPLQNQERAKLWLMALNVNTVCGWIPEARENLKRAKYLLKVAREHREFPSGKISVWVEAIEELGTMRMEELTDPSYVYDQMAWLIRTRTAWKRIKSLHHEVRYFERIHELWGETIDTLREVRKSLRSRHAFATIQDREEEP